MIAGRVAWSREESLANIVSVEMVDLPLSKLQAEMEDFGSRGGTVTHSYIPSYILYLYIRFDHRRVDIIDQVEHTYPLCGIFYFPWHRHEIEGTDVL